VPLPLAKYLLQMAVTFHIPTHTLFMYTFPFHYKFYELYIRHGVLNNYSIKVSQCEKTRDHVRSNTALQAVQKRGYFTVYSNVMYVKTEWYCEVHAALKPHTHMADGLVHKHMQCCLNVFQVEIQIRAGKQIYIKLRCLQHNAPLSVGAHSA
jgi:hypothetical protein